MLPLVLYDIPSKHPDVTWSPNPAKTRFVLGYKNLPYETVWLEYPDIAPKLKEVGASPNKRLDGSDLYTVPVLSDPNTGVLITDSWVIAEYLDKTYPEKLIFPDDSSKGLICAIDSAMAALQGASLRFSFLRTLQMLNEASQEYFRTTREANFAAKVEEWSPEGPKREAQWGTLENNFYGSAKKWYDKVEGRWMMGDTFSFADVILASHTLWFKKIYKDTEWKRVCSFHNGKWEKLLADVEKECNLA